MKKELIIILVSCLVMSGCGSNPVAVSADALVKESENTIVNGNSLKNLNEKAKEVAENMETQLEESIQDKEIEEEIEHLLQTPIPLTDEEICEMVAEKMSYNYGDTVDEVPSEITEEYNKRLKEKEEGIIYKPEEIYSKYMNISDAEIIELVNERCFELHNEVRAELGLPLFERDEELDEIADIRAEEISYFRSHTRPNGEDVFNMLRSPNRTAYGENILFMVNYEPNASCKEDYEWLGEAGFEGLCSSPGHYANITENHYTKIGIDSYVVHYDDGCIKVVTAFEFSN